MMLFIPEGTVVATGSRVVKMLGLFLNTCQALLADLLKNDGMAEWYGMLSTTKKRRTKFKKQSYT